MHVNAPNDFFRLDSNYMAAVFNDPKMRAKILKFKNVIDSWNTYYLGGKNLSVCLHAYLRLESTNYQKIGEKNKALQIFKRLTQTASF